MEKNEHFTECEQTELVNRILLTLEYLESFNEEDRNLYLINILRYGKRVD
jgi:hypothetical protein